MRTLNDQPVIRSLSLEWEPAPMRILPFQQGGAHDTRTRFEFPVLGEEEWVAAVASLSTRLDEATIEGTASCNENGTIGINVTLEI